MIVKTPFTIFYRLSPEKGEELKHMLNGVRCVTKPDETIFDYTSNRCGEHQEVFIVTNDTWLKTNLILYFGEGHVVY